VEKPLDKFDLIATQYALSMLVGRELDLTGMWRQFLPPALKLLGCRAGHIWLQCVLSDAGADAISFSYPRLAFADMNHAPLVRQSIRKRQSDAVQRAVEEMIEEGRLFYHLLPLGKNGFVVLQRTTPLPHHLLQLLKPILARLADSSLACMQHAFSEKARRDNERARIVFESIGDAVIVTDVDGRVEHLNLVAQTILGWSQAEAKGRALNEVFSIYSAETGATAVNPVDVVLRDGKAVELKNHTVLLTRDGRKVPVEDSAAPVKDAEGKISGAVLVFHDVTEQKRVQQQIERQANYDDLTGLPNRRLFADRLAQAMKESHRSGLPLALLFLDLDFFKEVNDTLGHKMGDLLLKETARRLGGCVRETDTVARLSGDEFTVLLTRLTDLSIVERIAGNICVALAEAFQLGTEQAYISVSTGITLYPNDAELIDDLFKFADQAMYAAKALGRNRFHYFTPALQDAADNHMRLTRDLRSALAEEQFVVYFQPIVELETGHAHKAEALLRWRHPQRGLVLPDEFIYIAEETGLINEIGDWVFRQAAQLTRHLRMNGHPEFQIGVNKSPVQFHSDLDSFGAWLDYLQQLGLPGSSIVVEITEGLLLDSDVTDRLLAMRDSGMQVALDDFGTGYSSLSYLKKYDIDYLKIDRSFVHDMTEDLDGQALCEAIIVMAHKLGLKVIAEGVETMQQRDLLFSMGCDYGQGFLFSVPLPALEFEQLLA
jgi:diguanylate cyclase (GGDEF)-like protein/PAS domain S-box-containing protein